VTVFAELHTYGRSRRRIVHLIFSPLFVSLVSLLAEAVALGLVSTLGVSVVFGLAAVFAGLRVAGVATVGVTRVVTHVEPDLAHPWCFGC
jgi:hypothetical protein